MSLGFKAMSLSIENTDLLLPRLVIKGHLAESSPLPSYSVHNPASGSCIKEVAMCGTKEAQEAIEAAQQAFAGWSDTPAHIRADRLTTLANLMVEHKSDLAKILCAEQGKPLAEAEGEILYGSSYFSWFAEEAKRIYGDVIASKNDQSRLLTIKQPVGVVACITPWNFPNAMIARKIAPALAAGCTVVCKPANETPLSAFAIAVLAQKAGIPDGVINMVTGHTEDIGKVLTEHSQVKKLTFTGSTPVGKKLIRDCASTVKRVSMELGGNAPFIVFESADLPQAVAGLLANKFRNAGQTCICANRVLVDAAIADEFASLLQQSMAELVVGDGMVPGTEVGPLIHTRAATKVGRLVDQAKQQGAAVYQSQIDSNLPDNYFPPTLVAGAEPTMALFEEEIFGPVISLFTFNTEAEAIALANATPFGLAAYFYSQDYRQMWRVAEQLEAGMVGVNDTALSNETIPFGGVKESGQGREGSKYGLDDYLEIKHIKFGAMTP